MRHKQTTRTDKEQKTVLVKGKQKVVIVSSVSSIKGLNYSHELREHRTYKDNNSVHVAMVEARLLDRGFKFRR